jgi:V8-like Glu-specific endopeptidase
MNPFDSDIFEPTSAFETHIENKDVVHATSRPRPVFFLVLATLCAGIFMPWIVLRIPGREVQEISLFRMTGGTAMVVVFFFFVSSGILLWLLKIRFGAALTAVAVAFVGWFAVFVSVALGAIRGMIPEVGVGNVDLGRGLVGIGTGAIIVIGALLLVAMETLPRGVSGENVRTRSLDGFGVVGFFIALSLALTHTAVWVSGQSDKFESGIRLSGDSLFGSFLISSLVWITAIIGVLTALRTTQKGGQFLSVMLIVSGLFKFFHALLFLLGQGLINLLLPDSVGEVATIESHWALWCTLALSLMAVGTGFISIISNSVRLKIGHLASFEYLPAIVLALITLTVVIGNPNRNSTSGASTNPATPTSLGTPSVSDGDELNKISTEGIARSVVLVTVTDSNGERCWSGSGVAVIDGDHFLTNHHVVVPEPNDDPSCVNLSVGITEDTTKEPTRYLPIEILITDEELDLAVVRLLNGEDISLAPISIREELLSLDTKIRVIGYPGVGGDTITVSEGIISGVDSRHGAPFYKVSAQISPGNSGGPMVDEKGQLVGIASAYVPAAVQCDSKDECYAAGANLGLVRPISYALGLLAKR